MSAPQLTIPQLAFPQRAWHADIMGMPISIHLRGHELHGFVVEDAVAAAFDELRRVDRLLSPYRLDSDLLRHRRGELPLSACDPVLAEVFELCTQATDATQGWFDPQVDTSTGRMLDPTGVVKGWAVARVSAQLAGLPEHDHYVNAAGDIATVVHDVDGARWRVGITDPLHGETLADVLACGTGGVATSGTAARGAHVYNPFTGRPATELASVTVTGPDLLWADVYATAALAHGSTAPSWLDATVGYEYLVVTATGQRAHSAGWAALRAAP